MELSASQTMRCVLATQHQVNMFGFKNIGTIKLWAFNALSTQILIEPHQQVWFNAAHHSPSPLLVPSLVLWTDKNENDLESQQPHIGKKWVIFLPYKFKWDTLWQLFSIGP
jgi:hypothetical protein